MLQSAILTTLLFASAATAQPLAEAATRSLAQRFPDEMHRLEVRVDRAADDVLAAASPTVVWPSTAEIPRGRVQVRVHDATGARVGVAMLHVAHFDTVVVAAAALKANEPVAPEHLTLSWRETTRLAGPYLRARDLATLPGDLFATRLVREGALLRPSDLRGAFAAEPGRPVELHYQRGDVRLVLRTEARETGHVGDAVRLYAPDTRTTYRARLVADGRAEWIETL